MAISIGRLLGSENPPRRETSINDCFIQSPRTPYVPRIDVLGVLTEKIILCESSGNPLAYNKWSGARGLLQIIPSSERFCEKGLGRELDMFNPVDNLACGEYLKKHGGLKHWESSRRCWSK